MRPGVLPAWEVGPVGERVQRLTGLLVHRLDVFG